MLKYFLAALICFCVSAASGQGIVRGMVFENKTKIILADIQVQNVTTSRNTVTDDKGRFSIAAKTGDVLIFKGFAYMPDTLLLTSLNDIAVFLTLHQNLLNDVKVTGAETKNMQHYYDPMFHGQAVVLQRDANLNPVGGIAIRFHDWHKDERRRKKLEQEEKDQEISDAIAKAFAPAIVSKYVPLKGRDLTDFISLYTPSTKVYSDNNFNVLSYLNGCYKEYLKLPEDKRHPVELGIDGGD